MKNGSVPTLRLFCNPEHRFGEVTDEDWLDGCVAPDNRNNWEPLDQQSNAPEKASSPRHKAWSENHDTNAVHGQQRLFGREFASAVRGARIGLGRLRRQHDER